MFHRRFDSARGASSVLKATSRFAEAIERGLWQPARNAVQDELVQLRAEARATRETTP